MAVLDFPAAPIVGQQFDRYSWDGEKWMLTPTGDGIGNGIVTYAKVSSIQSGITTLVDLTGMTVTFTAKPGRTYKISFQINIYSSVTDDISQVYVTDAANATQYYGEISQGPGVQGRSFSCSYIETGLIGTVTRKLRAQRSGTGSLTFNAQSTTPCFIIVEDVTPSSGGPPSNLVVPACHLYRTANLALTTAVITAVTWDAETIDTHGFHSTSVNTDRITIPIGLAGLYQIGFALAFESGAAGVRMGFFNKNGTAAQRLGVARGAPSLDAAYNVQSNTTLIYLNELDYLQLFAYHTQGTSVNLLSAGDPVNGGSYMWIQRLNS